VLIAGAALALSACSAPKAGTAPSATVGTSPGPAASGTTGAPSTTAVASTSGPAPLSELADAIRGRLMLPGQVGYADARLTENPRFDAARPLGVVRPADAKDVATVLRFARENEVPLALRSGGHSYAGFSSGGAPGTGMPASLVVDVRALDTVRLTGTTATIGAGAALAPVYAGLAAEGRALAGGSCATVGIAGLTLGGGVGVLTRAHGLTCDALRSAEVVTADGSVRTVDAHHDPDLFWALRGGGGGHLGVVTSLSFETFTAPTIKSFFYQWSFADAPEVIAAWQDWAPHADPRLWSTLKVLGGAAHPQGPVVLLSGTWVGDGAAPVADFLAKVVKPGVSSLKTRGYGAAMASYAGCAGVPTAQCTTGAGGALQREAFVGTSHVAYEPLDDAGIDALLDHVRAAQGSGLKEAGLSIDALGGRAGEPAPADTAFVHRSALATVQYTATFTGDRAEQAQSYVRGFRSGMVSSWGNHAYVNYADASLDDAATAYFGDNAARLARVRDRYDPDGLFTQPQAY